MRRCEFLRKTSPFFDFILPHSQNKKSYAQGQIIVEHAPTKRGTRKPPLTHIVNMIVFYPIKKSFFLTFVNKSKKNLNPLSFLITQEFLIFPVLSSEYSVQFHF